MRSDITPGGIFPDLERAVTFGGLVEQIGESGDVNRQA
jgi:hypothetical protein